MIRKLIILLFVSIGVISVKAAEFYELKKTEVTFSSVVDAIHNNAYLLAAIPNFVLFFNVFSQKVLQTIADYNQYKLQEKTVEMLQAQRSNNPMQNVVATIKKCEFSYKKEIDFLGPLIMVFCIRLVWASFWTLLGGKFLKYITKECMVDQRANTYKSKVLSDNSSIVQEC